MAPWPEPFHLQARSARIYAGVLPWVFLPELARIAPRASGSLCCRRGNRLATNPVVPRRIFEQGGANLVRGALNVLGDLERTLTGAWVAGRDVALTLRVVGDYRMGDRAPMSDLMARNAGAHA